jgi:hypothetical protein
MAELLPPQASRPSAIISTTFIASTNRRLKEFTVPPGFDGEQPHTMEFRAQGDLLTVLLDGAEVARVQDSTIMEPGRVFISGSLGPLIEKFEYRELPAASSASSTATKAAPISKSSDPKFPPGQWVKLFTKPEDLPADLRETDSGVKFEDGWIRFGQMPRGLDIAGTQSTNLGVRARILYRGQNREGNRIGLRGRTGSPQYQLGLSPSGQNLQAQKWNGPGDTTLLWNTPTPIPEPGVEYTMEFGVVGNRLIGRYGNSIVKMGTDNSIQNGAAKIYGTEDIRDIEVMNLDGLPEAEALRLLGVDEQGNDLRGKTGAPSASATPTPVWRDALAEAPLKGVIATADHTDKGYLLPPGNHWEFPAQPVRAGAIRVLAVTEAGSPNHLSLNFGLPGTRDHYQVFFRRKLNECGLGYLKEGLPERRLALKKGVHVADGEPHELLLARIADQFYFLLNGEVILQATEPDPTARYLTLNYFGDTHTRVQKVEYLNLDGVSEAEALRLLGVDEQGNDLRGKTGAAK